jgi:hypothetical protein
VVKPVPTSPMIRSPGMRQSSDETVRVGEPLMPSLRSGAPKETPLSFFSTTKALMPPRLPFSGSVTAKTV